MCANRIKGRGCHQQSAILDVYEAQIEAYLENFIIPDDYQQKILEAHSKLEAAYDDSGKRRNELLARLERNKKLFRWGDIGEQEYIAEKDNIEKELRLLVPPQKDVKVLDKLATFLANVAQAWREADQEQRNALGRQLFDEVWLKDKRVIAVKPRAELEPFFRISYDEWSKKFECAASTPIGVATESKGDRTIAFLVFLKRDKSHIQGLPLSLIFDINKLGLYPSAADTEKS